MDVTMLNLCGNATVPDANFIQARLADFTGSYGRTDSLYSNCPLVLAEQHEQSDVEQVRRMLATYEREMNSVMGQLEEMRENLDGTRWATQC
eukprot:scaffold199732_cov19-Tisochrysis_lutea.AAC.1